MFVLSWKRPLALFPPGTLAPRFLLSIPFVYLGIVPFLLLDAFLEIYQRVCFSAWGVPRARRSDYLLFDRAKLPYLDAYQRLNCHYCSYATGLAAYLREVAARTEQYWCPVKHAEPPPAPHSRYHRFLEHGDAHGYLRRLEAVRSDFSDLRKE